MGDTLMLMSDGIAEAQDEHGLLFGFDRIDQMLRGPITAAALATAAQNFGQQDDILVLRIERDGEWKTATELEPEMAHT
jgi:serine phosphatase RsbU (regulator of sigma subunit)